MEKMSKDSINLQGEGNKRIYGAITGLLIALSSYLMLYSINPNLVQLHLNLQKVQVDGFGGATAPPGTTGIGSGNTVGGVPTAGSIGGGAQGTPITPGSTAMNGLQQPGETAAQAILRNALYAADPAHPLDTCSVAGTDGGNKGCAYAVNDIVQSALGQPIGGNLSTAAMYQALQTNPNFKLVPEGLAGAKPGDIVISPSTDGVTGHVGIEANNGAIISNSSGNGKVQQNFNNNAWLAYYSGTQGNKQLPTYVYHPVN